MIFEANTYCRLKSFKDKLLSKVAGRSLGPWDWWRSNSCSLSDEFKQMKDQSCRWPSVKKWTPSTARAQMDHKSRIRGLALITRLSLRKKSKTPAAQQVFLTAWLLITNLLRCGINFLWLGTQWADVWLILPDCYSANFPAVIRSADAIGSSVFLLVQVTGMASCAMCLPIWECWPNGLAHHILQCWAGNTAPEKASSVRSVSVHVNKNTETVVVIFNRVTSGLVQVAPLWIFIKIMGIRHLCSVANRQQMCIYT